jgi:CubicO group peptidase (beta-lactamase class C family)
VSNESIALIDSICKINPTISVFFSNPYLLSKFKNLPQHAAVLELYEYNRFSQKAAADAITGALNINGKLPVSTAVFKINTGIELSKTQESFCAYPVKEKPRQLLRNKLQEIDSIALDGIKDGAFPGCQILAMKDGNIIYNKSFGRFTYDKYDTRVSDSSVYDLASLTKILASSLVIMKLVDEGKLELDSTLSFYLPELKGSNKAGIKIREMISHQAGLQAWLPFYQKTMNKKNEYKHGYYDTKKSKDFPTRVAENLYIKKHFTDTIYKRITESSLEKKGEYLYSDLGYYYIMKIAEKITAKSYDQYLNETFYKPLGINLHYQAREHFSLTNIVPTENDTKFRKQLIRGDVHDQGAAMMGGIAGHAGLFGTAKDVATIMQLLLNKGKYNGVSYISEEVVDEFTRKCAFCPNNRRGLCFDKPEMNADKDSPVTKECSAESFGHSGFTGTFTWADPANGLVLVFLSNRVYPDAENKKLTKSGIRSKIHKLLYEAIANGEVNN